MGRIDRLEVKDFKSYGGEHVIGPFRRFTAVIGPNGSGKSNLMDAISFVLGVHSRHLRSNQLKDLMHKSSNTEALDSASSSEGAYVVLVYSESDSESKFMRRISGKGISSYHMNGKEVSWELYQKQLKEIGVLVNARNFLVFQGDVEAIASKKPEELTKLFEKISFSNELRQEYEQLLEAKTLAEENTIFAYQKKKGLVAEKQMVKEQRDEAKTFEAKQKELEEMELKNYLWQLYEVTHDFKVHEERLVSVKAELKSYVQQEEEGSGTYKQQKKEYRNKLRELKQRREIIRDLQQELKKLEPKRIKIKQQKDLRKKQIEEAKKANIAHEKKILKTKEDIQGLQKDLEDLRQAKIDFEKQMLLHKENNKDIVMEGSQLEEYHRIREAVQIKTNTIRTKLECIQRQQKVDQEKKDMLTQELKESEAMVTTLTEELHSADVRIEKMKKCIFHSERAMSDAEKEIREAQNKFESEAKEREKLEKAYEQTQQQLQDLKDDQCQTQAEQRKKEILDTLKRLFPGVRGRLFDLCKPIQRKYNMALTVATGKHMDSLVVSDFKTGQDCIHYLRESRMGTASFIPLDKIRIKPINERFRTLGQNVKLILDIVQCDQDIEPALIYAVSDTVVCDTIDDARRLCFTQREKLKAVTMNGMVVSKNGSMTGGKTPRDMARAGRWDQKEIDKLQQSKDEIGSRLSALSSSGGSFQTVQTLQLQLENLKNQSRYAKADLITTEAKKVSHQNRLADVLEHKKQDEKELQSCQKAMDVRKQKLMALEDEIHGVEDEMFADFSKHLGVPSIREYEEKTLKRYQQQLETKRKLTEHIAKIEAQIAYMESEDSEEAIAAIKKKLQRSNEMLQQLQQEETKLEEHMHRFQDEQTKEQGRMKALSAQVETLEKELDALGNKKCDLEKQKHAFAKEIAKYDASMDRIREHEKEILKRACLEQIKLPILRDTEDIEMQESSFLESSLSQAAEDSFMELSAQATANYQKQNIDFSLLHTEKELVQDARERDRIKNEYEENIAKLQAELELMQPNMRALDKFEEIQLRIGKEEANLDRIKQQSLQAAADFDKIKSARHKRFMEAFNHVTKVIDETYKKLTKSSKHPLGGTAYLSLDNTEEPYLGGIKYHAMPPMKRFREMEQLSGGEKTVAALGLLFAIHSYRPSPFFILDEVDAALDNVNVNKVSTFIANCDVQCIVISLKDAFYEKADALIGICKDIKSQRSKSLTLDLDQFDA